MRIAHITNALRLDGTGHTNSTIDLAIEQVRRGHSVLLLCERSDEPTRRLLEQHGVTLVDGASVRSVDAVRRSWRLVRAVLPHAQVLHLHTVRSFAVAALLGPVRAWRRSVSTIHNPHQRSVWLMYGARRVVSLSAADQAHVRRRTGGLRTPAVVLNATLGTPRLPPLVAVAPRPLPPASIVFVGALHRRKGLDVLIEAMPEIARRAEDAQLFVVGNRDDPEFEDLAEDRGVADRVHFVGFSEDPREYMLAASVFVLPSRQEGFGNVLTEARECGVPIVASRTGGIPEALSHGRAGLLVEPGSSADLASAVTSVLLDPDRASALRRATQTDLDHMRVPRAERDYAEVYRTVLVTRADAG